MAIGCQVGKPQYYQGFSGIRGMTKMEEKMKIKLFYQRHNQSIEGLENRLNSFMATVEVVDVKYTEATTGHYEELETNTGLLVLYK